MSNEIKLGDKVRVSSRVPRIYERFGSMNAPHYECKVVEIDDGMALLDSIPAKYVFLFPLKYLVKVDAEAKEAKFKVGDRVRVKGCGYEPNLHKGDIGEILDTNGKEQCFVLFKKSQAWIYADCLEPYTEPTEQTEVEKPNHTITIPVEVDLTDSYWDAYSADLAKEVVLKTVNSASDRRPSAIAEYATDIAKAVVEGLKRK